MGHPETPALGDHDPLLAGVVDRPPSAFAERPGDQVDPWVRRHRDRDDSPPGGGGEYGQMVPDQGTGLRWYRKRFARTRLCGTGQK